MSNQYSGDLRASILDCCARPYGLATNMIPGYTIQQVGRMVQKLQAAGLIHAAKTQCKHRRYFDSAERATEYAKTAVRKPRDRGDKQLRADARFDTARAVNEQAAALKASNRSDYTVTPEDEAKIRRYPTPPSRFAPIGEVPRVVLASEARPWAEAATERMIR